MVEAHQPSPLAALVEDAWRRARRRRLLVSALVAAIALGVALFLLVPSGGRPGGGSAHGVRATKPVTDSILRVKVPQSWHSSVAFGSYGSETAAYILVGNFSFPRDAAKQEAGPKVPPGRVLIRIGDFPLEPRPLGGIPHVDRLRLPSVPANRLRAPRSALRTEQRAISWEAFYGRRFLALSATFGFQPTPQMRGLVNQRLATVRRIGPDKPTFSPSSGQ